MAGRPYKARIDYAGWSVDMFDGDTKIDKLLDAHGWIGFGIYFYFCQKAYGTDGYFYKWCFADGASTARRMGGGIGAKTITEVVGYCLQIGLFDKGLFDRWGILTSRGIQRRYCVAAASRRDKKVASEYWLLPQDESCGFLIIPLNGSTQSNNSIINGNNSIIDTDNSIMRDKSKVKESKVNKSISADATADTIERYTVEQMNHMSPSDMQELVSFTDDLTDEVIRYAVDKAVERNVRKWAYVRSILNDYAENGLKTLDKVKEHEAERSEKIKAKGKNQQAEKEEKPQMESWMKRRF